VFVARTQFCKYLPEMCPELLESAGDSSKKNFSILIFVVAVRRILYSAVVFFTSTYLMSELV